MEGKSQTLMTGHEGAIMNLWHRFRIAVRDWWIGKFVERGEPFNAIGPRAEQMPLWKYFRAHHRWIIGTVGLGLLGLYVSARF
jgi:hypothetical protein